MITSFRLRSRRGRPPEAIDVRGNRITDAVVIETPRISVTGWPLEILAWYHQLFMVPNVDEWSIVVAGAWNAAIFNPAWLQNSLLNQPQAQVQLEIAVNDLSLSPRLSFDRVRLRVASGRLIIGPRTIEDPDLQRTLDLARRIVELLPHTPITAIGVNFQFVEEHPGDDRLANLFAFSDHAGLVQRDYQTTVAGITRSLVRAGRTLNLTISRTATGRFLLDFNFHSEARTPEQRQQGLATPMETLRAEALALASDLYGLELT